MKRIVSLLSIITICATTALAQVGTWRTHMSYYEPQQIVKVGNKLFVRASNDLYNYNLTDHSITTYDKVRQLNDTYITLIGWNNQASRLVIVYNNSNIDLLDLSDNVVNISALFTKSMTQNKTVNSIYMHQQYAYLATAFGVVKVNVQRAEIAESYILNENVAAIGISGENIYIRNTSNKVLTGLLSSNLIDPHNWTTATGTVPAGVFSTDNTDWTENLELVQTLQLDGPKYNHFGFMRLKNGTLYTCGGGWSPTNDLQRPATLQLYDLAMQTWTILPDDMTGVAGTESNNWKFVDMMTVDVDPTDSKRVIGTGRTGLYEYYDGAFVKYYNKDNSLLKNSINSSSNKYVITQGSMFDPEGNLWCLVSETRGDNFVEWTKDGEWISRSLPELYNDNVSLTGLQALFQDSRGYFWFVNNHYITPSIYCYDPQANTLVNMFKTLTNQDGITYSDYTPSCVAEDFDGNIWVGTNNGPFVIEPERITTPDTYVTQIKVPRNDGTNYADYLLSGAYIKCMAIDGGGRKWFGTLGSGLYLISADNMTEIAHFTTENSPLLSNNVESLAIDNTTGELFIGTEDGLCSYMTDATEAVVAMVKDNVYAYPNPVVSGYDGLITVVGLSLDADVKILSTSGQLVAEGRSNGGTFTWNGHDRQGRRVASGVYMVAAATSDGKKGTVCKIAIIK